jgi:hypothetical protein
MKTVSPFKFVESDLNFMKISSNPSLGEKLRDFFKDTSNDYLWKISTHRQTITHALRYTESIPLRYLKDLPKGVNTLEANQHMTVTDSQLMDIPLFKDTVKWIEEALLSTGAREIQFGRIFPSKLEKNSVIDLHTDEGAYFSYYDRFHFTLTAADENFFVIRDEPCVLEEDSLYWVNNHVPHWLENKSSIDRINFIIDARLI